MACPAERGCGWKMLNDKQMTDERRRAIEQLARLIEAHGIDAIKAALRELVRRQKEGEKT